MPYATNADIPSAVRERYSDRCQTVWREAWNAHQGDEASAFAVAETAAKSCADAGKAVKYVDGSDSLIEGLAIPFGGPFAGKDLDGEDFGPDTDFALDWFPSGRPVIYQHGIDGAMKTALQGRQTEHDVSDEGIWARAQLDLSAKYHATVARLIEQGKLFFSSGSIAHLVRGTKDGHITRWPWVELSLTPNPANLFAEVHSVKSADIITRLAEAGIDPPAALIAEALRALDAIPTDDPPAGVKFAEHADRLLDDVLAFRERLADVVTIRGKSGRVLSASTRERLLRHPASLRELADDLDDLLSGADADKVAKAVDAELINDVAETLARAALVGVST